MKMMAACYNLKRLVYCQREGIVPAYRPKWPNYRCPWQFGVENGRNCWKQQPFLEEFESDSVRSIARWQGSLKIVGYSIRPYLCSNIY